MSPHSIGSAVVCIAMGAASVALAGNGNENAGVSLHVTAPIDPVSCQNAPSFSPQGGQAIKPKGSPCPGGTGEFDVWVAVCNGSDTYGVAGVEYGIQYNGALGAGVDVVSWRLCGSFQFNSTNYPESGGGNLVVWEPTGNCQNVNSQTNGNPPPLGSVIAVAGVLRVVVYGGDMLRITPRPVNGKLTVGNCNAFEDDLTNAITPRGGVAAFCANFGQAYNACKFGVLSVEETTWGAIKSLYRD